MFPMIGFLCAHGAKKMLQFPMLGFWLAFPAGLATLERLHRVYCGFITVPAFWNVLDDDTVVMTCKRPHARPWHYSAGQYILLQVPAVSFFQWHPFTISHCEGDLLQLHIKTDGNWTSKLRELPFDIQVGIDGPFGAPAQRFYEYNRSLIIGAGVGITPFSAIISDLEQHIYEKDGWSRRQSRHIHGSLSLSRRTSRKSSRADSASSGWDNNDGMISVGPGPLPLIEVPSARRVDFHWLVREKNSLLWFSDLLDSANDMSKILPPGYLDLNIYTHITTKQDNLSTYIFQYLLDAYRTETYPVSTITGLKMRSRFGRPDFKSILENFNDDVKRQIEQGHIQKGEKIAVFFCGPPAIGTILSDMCYELTLRGKADSTNIRWDFRMEVFG
jgi:respiratory burst oxidase